MNRYYRRLWRRLPLGVRQLVAALFVGAAIGSLLGVVIVDVLGRR